MNMWQEWFAAQQAASKMTVERASLSDAKDWGLQGDGTHFGRHDGKFFEIVGVLVMVPDGREVSGWNQPLVWEVGEGALVLLKRAGEEEYLVAAKPEPGNNSSGRVLLAPPLQASKSNLGQAHGGKRPPRAELLDRPGVQWVVLHKDGGRYLDSSNHGAIVEVGDNEIQLNPNERWFTREELRQAFRAGACNAHLRELIGLALV